MQERFFYFFFGYTGGVGCFANPVCEILGFAGGNDRAKLCSEVEEAILNQIFVGYDEGRQGSPGSHS